MPPFVDERRGIELGGGVQQPQRREARHHAQPAHRARQGAAARARRGLRRGHRELRRRRARAHGLPLRGAAARSSPTSSTCRTPASARRGPYSAFKTWGPIVQAVCGLTFSIGLPDQPPAGWGFSYMDHMGANIMAVAILAGLIHRNRTGEGQWIDMACTEAGTTLVRSRPARLHGQRPPAAPRPGSPTRNRSHAPRDGAARHLPGRGRRRLDRDRVPRRRRLGAASPR